MRTPIVQFKPGKFITVIVRGEKPRTLLKTDVGYLSAIRAWKAKKYDVLIELFDKPKIIAKYTDGKVKVFDNEVLYNDTKVNPYIEKKIIAALKEKDILVMTSIVKFLDNLMQNPIEFIQADLFEFLENNNMPINADGAFLAFKLSDVNGHPPYHKDDSITYKKGSIHEMPQSNSSISQNMCDGSGFYFGRRDYWHSEFDKDGRFTGEGIMWVAKIFPQWVTGIPGKVEPKGKSYRMEIVDEYRMLRRHVWDKHFVDLSKVTRATRESVKAQSKK